VEGCVGGHFTAWALLEHPQTCGCCNLARCRTRYGAGFRPVAPQRAKLQQPQLGACSGAEGVEGGQGQEDEGGAGEEGALVADLVPEQAGGDAGEQEGEAGEKVEHAEGGAAQVSG